VPTYQYACTVCEERLEAVQKFSDDPLTECPACGGRLRKLFSAVGIVFKGSGFYRNDSRSSGVNGTKDKDKDKDKQVNAASSGSSTSSETSTGADKKPASSGSESSSGGTKPQADKASSGSSPATGTKVA
jgi:putative FmdB family regulatory protein